MDSRLRGATLGLMALPLLAISAESYGQPATARPAARVNASQSAPNERTKGFMLGAHVVAAPGVTLGGGVFENSYTTSFGAGAGLMLGYGFNRVLSSYVSFDFARQNPKASDPIRGSFGLGHLEIGARANLALGMANSVPYLSASFGQRSLGARTVDDDGNEADVTMQGRMVGLGIGVEHFFSPTMSLDGGLQFGFGKFDHLTMAGRELTLSMDETTSTRLRIGITWRPCVSAPCAKR